MTAADDFAKAVAQVTQAVTAVGSCITNLVAQNANLLAGIPPTPDDATVKSATDAMAGLVASLQTLASNDPGNQVIPPPPPPPNGDTGAQGATAAQA